MSRAAQLAIIGFAAVLCMPWSVAAQPSLGTAQPFAVLAGSTVTNTGPTVLTGDVGVSPGAAIVGFPPGVVVTGAVHAGDAVAAQAQVDLTNAYITAAGLPCQGNLTGQNLGGLTLTPGVYCFATSAQLTGTLTLDAQGNAASVFVFQVGSTLTTASNSMVNVINGGSTCNVFWQIGSSATLGTNTAFVGNILALTSITLNTGVTIVGRALARNGAVTLDSNQVTTVCGAPAPPAPPAPPVPPPGASCPVGGILPVISPIPAQTIPVNGSTTVRFSATGRIIPDALVVSATSSDLTLVPASAIQISRAEADGSRTLTIRGADGRSGAAIISVTVRDPTTECAAVTTFQLTVLPAVPTLAEWAMIALTLLLAFAGFLALRARVSGAARLPS